MTKFSKGRFQKLAGLLNEQDRKNKLEEQADDYGDLLLKKWGGRYRRDLPDFDELSAEDKILWKQYGPPPESKEELEEDKLQDELIDKYMHLFRKAGFDDYDIDFSNVKPKAIKAMGEALKKLYG